MSLYADWTLAELKAFRKELAKAHASGSLSVRFADRSITYRSLSEMERVADALQDEIDGKEGTNRIRQIRINSEKGFGCG